MPINNAIKRVEVSMTLKCLRLEKGSEFELYYQQAKQYLIARDERSFVLDDYFTPHDSSHCRAIEQILDVLLSKSQNHLSELEKFILLISIWCHDLGMFSDIAKEYFQENGIAYSSQEKRRNHDLISAWHLMRYFIDIFGEEAVAFEPDKNMLENKLRNYITCINVIIKFHRRATSIDDCTEFMYVNGERIRTKLLACLLRLGDTLHIDSSRYHEKSYNILQVGEFDRFARLHWLKSYMISSIYLDEVGQSAIINIDLPDVIDVNVEIDEDICDCCSMCVKICPRSIFVQDGETIKIIDTFRCHLCRNCIRNCPKGAINLAESLWKENIESLKHFISNDIYEDIIAVSETFRENKMPVYLTVKCNINFIPGFNAQKIQEILGVLSDLDLIFSPNSTRTIVKALEGIKYLSKIKYDDFIIFYRQFDQVVERLDQILEERPCHIGLSKIIIKLKTCGAEFKDKREDNIQPFKTRLAALVEDVLRERKRNWKKIYVPEKLKILDEKENIFLLGYSEMVTKFLKEYANRNHEFYSRANIYIFEGASKRRYTTNNILEYDDGIYYATQISRSGFKNIAILPDFCSASLMNILNDTNKDEFPGNSIVLFGANGIDFTKRLCAHSSGHLALAIIAKRFLVDVVVIADSFKMGDLEWNLSSTRKSDWLTTQTNFLRELNARNIELIDYREDKIPSELVSTIISDVN